MNTCITIVVWFFCGYGIAFGDDEKLFTGST